MTSFLQGAGKFGDLVDSGTQQLHMLWYWGLGRPQNPSPTFDFGEVEKPSTSKVLALAGYAPYRRTCPFGPRLAIRPTLCIRFR